MVPSPSREGEDKNEIYAPLEHQYFIDEDNDHVDAKSSALD